MDWLLDIDWRGMFIPDTAIVELVIRGSIMYLALYFLLRVVLKRQSGGIGITDLLVIVLIADAAQNAMGDDYQSIPNGIILVATIIFWSYTLDWLGYRFPRIEPLVYAKPLQLVREGQMLRHNMERETMTEGELMSQLRLQGVEDISVVKVAYLEGDGRVSVIVDGSKDKGASPRHRP
ncbi:MAG TPA: YetF domain-containing protein [Thermomicrobiales bacterium]|nr:YetF domain-containing protein [Thermomicrobiales bacterium]